MYIHVPLLPSCKFLNDIFCMQDKGNFKFRNKVKSDTNSKPSKLVQVRPVDLKYFITENYAF